jgi:5'-3' exonuclease
MNTYSKIIVDLSNLYYKNYFTHQDQKVLVENEEIMTGGIYGFIRSLRKLQRDFLSEEGQVYILADNFSSKDSYRKQIDPAYKLNRKKYQDSFYRGIDFLALILMNTSNKIFTVQVESYEADDLVPAVLDSFDKYDKVLIVSDDLDYSRVIKENVDWYKNKIIYNKDNFKEKYGFYPTEEKVVLYKVIRGDASDNIEIGVKGIRENIVLDLLEKYKDIYDLLENIDTADLDDKWKTAFIENKTRLILNHQLVSFIDISKEEVQQFTYQGCFNPNTLRSLYKTLGFQISDIHPELQNSFPEKIVDGSKKTFFNFDRLPRK